MVVCAAAKCSNSSRIKNMRFFKFPSEEQRRKLWIENSNLPKEPGPYAKLCEVHFEQSQFELHRQDGWHKLKPNAIPTFFPEPSQSEILLRGGCYMKKDKTTPHKKHKRSLSPEDSDIDVDVPPNIPPLKIVRRKKRHDVATDKNKPTHKKNSSRNSAENSKSSQKENVSPRRRKGRPRKVSTPEESSSSETEVDYELEDEPEYSTKTKDTEEQEKQLALLKKENESMRQEIQEFEKHNKAMSRVIMELEKHNKAMSAKLQELDKDNKVMSKKLGDLEKQNEDLRSKLNCCFSEEQFQRMEKLMALGKIERYIPGIK